LCPTSSQSPLPRSRRKLETKVEREATNLGREGLEGGSRSKPRDSRPDLTIEHSPESVALADGDREPRAEGSNGEDVLHSALGTLLQSSPAIEGAAIIRSDGFPVVTALPATCNSEGVAAMSSTLARIAGRAFAVLEKGPVSHMFVQGYNGDIILMSAGDTACYLVAMASRDAPTGQILYELHDCKSRIEGSLKEMFVRGDRQESLA
jgi:predicted regulator of Ras-like GTPase activity (Roadblock/LC7/MglB family)